MFLTCCLEQNEAAVKQMAVRGTFGSGGAGADDSYRGQAPALTNGQPGRDVQSWFHSH